MHQRPVDRQAVVTLLANARYRGAWAYGKTQNIWQSSKDYARQVPRPQPLRQGQFEELRIVADGLWFKAQKRLGEDREAAGRKPKDGDRKARPLLLNRLLYCHEHGCRPHVGGAHGWSMYCPQCRRLPREKRPLYSLLNRVLALKRTCGKLAAMIRADPPLVAEILAACRREAENAQRPDPEVPYTGRVGPFSGEANLAVGRGGRYGAVGGAVSLQVALQSAHPPRAQLQSIRAGREGQRLLTERQRLGNGRRHSRHQPARTLPVEARRSWDPPGAAELPAASRGSLAAWRRCRRSRK